MVITNVSWSDNYDLGSLKNKHDFVQKSYHVVKGTFILGVRLASPNESFEKYTLGRVAVRTEELFRIRSQTKRLSYYNLAIVCIE